MYRQHHHYHRIRSTVSFAANIRPSISKKVLVPSPLLHWQSTYKIHNECIGIYTNNNALSASSTVFESSFCARFFHVACSYKRSTCVLLLYLLLWLKASVRALLLSFQKQFSFFVLKDQKMVKNEDKLLWCSAQLSVPTACHRRRTHFSNIWCGKQVSFIILMYKKLDLSRKY